jgi:hypothetical protein
MLPAAARVKLGAFALCLPRFTSFGLISYAVIYAHSADPMSVPK